LICGFIAENRHRFGGVASICRVLIEHGCQIAPRTFWAWRTRAPSKRELSDLVLTEVLAGIYEPVSGAAGRRSRCTGC
jgi:putative transposase